MKNTHQKSTGEYTVILRDKTTDKKVFKTLFEHDGYRINLKEPPKFIVDLGAYTGLSTVYFRQKYPYSRIVSVEPNPDLFSLLKLNTENIVSSNDIFNAAIWIDEGYGFLKDQGTGDWGWLFSEDGGEYASVKKITMDSIFKHLDTDFIDILKVDIEGSEKELFENSFSWIDKIGMIIIETHDRIKRGCQKAVDDATRDKFIKKKRKNTNVIYWREYVD